MIDIKDFEDWMRKNTLLSERSIYKYSHAVKKISEEMMGIGVIDTDLLSMSLIQLNKSILSILDNKDFASKNQTGNNMYSNALSKYQMFRNAVDDQAVSEQKTTNITDISNITENQKFFDETERDAVIKSRICQGVFRERIIKKYNGRCVITGISLTRILVASHIKPWKVCSSEERVSAENGLLLSPTYDKLFDYGLISFYDNGKLMISSEIPKSDVSKLCIASQNTYNLKISQPMKEHLEYHRDMIFIK